MSPLRPQLKRDLRTFAIGAACGFLAGALLVAIVVSRYGSTLGVLPRPPAPSAAGDRWDDGMADVDVPVLQGSRRPGEIEAARPDGAVSIGPAPPTELTGRGLQIPVEGVKPEQLTRTFSDTRSGVRIHEAIDIAAPRNTPVKAVDDGTVARLFFSKAGGITIYQFDPSEKFCYYYAHLERYADGLQEGDRVKKGQVIGYVGVSGNAPKDSPHLHFAVFRLTAAKRWWEGTPIDPYDILR
jgi:murein DD-endopeptidase MepM/ murein hydrolase activator NlpD